MYISTVAYRARSDARVNIVDLLMGLLKRLLVDNLCLCLRCGLYLLCLLLSLQTIIARSLGQRDCLGNVAPTLWAVNGVDLVFVSENVIAMHRLSLTSCCPGGCQCVTPDGACLRCCRAETAFPTLGSVRALGMDFQARGKASIQLPEFPANPLCHQPTYRLPNYVGGTASPLCETCFGWRIPSGCCA